MLIAAAIVASLAWSVAMRAPERCRGAVCSLRMRAVARETPRPEPDGQILPGSWLARVHASQEAAEISDGVRTSRPSRTAQYRALPGFVALVMGPALIGAGAADVSHAEYALRVDGAEANSARARETQGRVAMGVGVALIVVGVLWIGAWLRHR
jgi:hypothetical protein